MGTSPIYMSGISVKKGIIFNSSDTTAVKDLIVAVAPLRVYSVTVVNEDSVTDPQGAHIWWHDGTTAFRLGQAFLSAAAGFGQGPAFDNFDEIFDDGVLTVDNNGNSYFQLEAGEKLQIGMDQTINSGNEVHFVAIGELL